MANSVCRSDFGYVTAFLELVAESAAQGNHRFFHIVIEENGCGDGGEKKDEPAQPEGMVVELVESQPEEKEMSEIDAVRVPSNIFEDLAEQGSGDFAELRKQQTKSEATPPRAGNGVVAQIGQRDQSEGDRPERRRQIKARKRCGFVSECAGHESGRKNEPVREAKFFHVVRAQTRNDCDDPKKSERQRRAPPFCDEINQRKKEIHAHFVRQTPERSN